ncbi:MAG: diaminopimelate decarboxylase [Clostridia bacterium]|nr:diaminopimelate decarboxylase [Clostridia bacterium]
MAEFVMDNCSVNENGHLTVAGVDTVELARRYGTPLMVLDENKIRSIARVYKEAMRKYFGEGSMPLFASKALSFTGIYRIMAEEGIGSDAVSSGEIYTAKNAGFDISKMVFHGNNKTDADIEYAISLGIGRFVVDGDEELEAVNEIAGRHGIKQRIELRITPGIDPHTHKAISTGRVDSKFGNAIATGQAEKITVKALSLPNIELMGFHCHIGSQIFEVEPFVQAAEIMMKYIADIKKKTGFTAKELNLGGGFGVRYVKEHPYFDYGQAIKTLADKMKRIASISGIAMPIVFMEPGRSMVASAGLTLYTVGSVKRIPDMKNYVSVDGGMTDNPRYALYQSQYEMVIANKADKKADFACSVAGRCCESGDLLAENIMLQGAEKGDVLAVLVTGAYNYAMASNYNRIPRPELVMIRDGEPYVAIKRESFEDLIRNEI